MRKKLLFISALLAATVARGQNFAIDPTKPVDASEVEIMAVNVALFEGDSVHIVSPDKVEAAMARRVSAGDVTDGKQEGRALIPKAYLYSYKYPSVDADGNRIMLSSMMAIPTDKVGLWGSVRPNNVVIGCHVTITSNYECPTQYNSDGNYLAVMSDVSMQICYTRNDFIRQACSLVIMPDYEGYGATVDRPHPYLYQELTARQVVDAARYGLAYYNAHIDEGLFAASNAFKSLEDGWKTVCVGYSQGGSVSLATHRFIEENGLSDELHFAGSVCGDGPYDPVEHMRYYMTDDGETYHGSNRTAHKKESVSMPIVMPLILKGMCDRNPFMRQHQVSDYLTEKFLNTGAIVWINSKSEERKHQFSTGDITKKFRDMRDNGHSTYTRQEMQAMFFQDIGDNVHAYLSEMLVPEGLAYFRTLEEDGPVPTERGLMQDLHRALASNSLVSGWTPTHRIGFYHSTYDTVVPYANLLSFIRHQKGLKYYNDDWTRAVKGVSGFTTVGDPSQADVYIIDNHSSNDHVNAGRDFYMMGMPAPDYKLMKWVLEGKK